ncbi:unnamed protein product [Diamesa tonsa]
MLEEISEITLFNMERSIASIASSFNSKIIHWGNSKNSNNYYTTNYIMNDRSLQFEDLLADVFEKEAFLIDSPNIENQNAFNFEVFPNDQKIIELICVYLSQHDKLTCMLVCKRFYKIIFSMDDLLYFDASNNPIRNEFPKLFRSYKQAELKNIQYFSLNPLEKIRMKHLSKSLINLTINNLSIEMKELCALLQVFPKLESLCLDIDDMKNKLQLSSEDIPKLLHLKSIKLATLGNLNDALAIFDSAPNVESLSLVELDLRIDEFNYFLKKHKNHLKSLTLNFCLFFSDLKYSKIMLNIPMDFRIFDDLHQLREVYLICAGPVELQLLRSKCINWLTDLVLVYNSMGKEEANSFYLKYLKIKEIDEVQLSEYDASKGPITINSKSLISPKCRTLFYHIHHCASEYNPLTYDHNKCLEIPLTNKELTWIDNLGENMSLYIQVRENLKEFKDIKEKLECLDI